MKTQVKIGMEIHVELATRTKMFTRVPSVGHPDHYDAPPNSLVDPVVAGLPGALPSMNARAVEMSMMVGLALGCEIAEFSKWDRKNYFYPDLPKGYQISQYDLPLCLDGAVEIEDDDGDLKRIGIIRAHLEEDTGKLSHELPGGDAYDGSLLDLNRAGTPLLEIVSQPDLASAGEAERYGRAIRRICRYLGVTEGIMQRGHMRFEPNVNVIIETDDGRTAATPVVEIKNLNSFRAVHDAIEFEHKRQVKAWQEDGLEHGLGMKSTRGWDEGRGVTFLQRSKEDAHDYRYFPEPDLLPVVVSREWRDEVAATLPELPRAKRDRYQGDYGLSATDIDALTEDPGPCLFFEACISAARESTTTTSEAAVAAATAKLLLNLGAKRANELGVGIDELGITPNQVADVVALRAADEIGSTAADTLFGLLCERDESARAVAEDANLLQVADDSALDSWIDAAIEAEPKSAEDFAAGKDAAIGRLMGAVMKASGGQADAKAVRERLASKLRS